MGSVVDFPSLDQTAIHGDGIMQAGPAVVPLPVFRRHLLRRAVQPTRPAAGWIHRALQLIEMLRARSP